MASPALIQRAGEALAEAAGSSARVILFGSHAHGEARSDSDVDFLVGTMLHDALTQGRVLVGTGS